RWPNVGQFGRDRAILFPPIRFRDAGRRRRSSLDERAEKAKRRFENMLADARAALAEASGGIPSGNLSPRALLGATKALNRAGGFLEAVSIAQPELGLELIEEFEAFAAEVDQLSASFSPEGS